MTAAVVCRDPWTVRLDGIAHVARPVSGERVRQFFRAASEPGGEPEALVALLRWAFPIRLSNLWRGDPVRQILRLPADQQREILTDFFARWAGRSGGPPGSRTSGIALRR